MTNPSDVPQPEQPGAQPPASNVPPAGHQPPQGYQQPPGYQAPGQEYGQPTQPGQPGGFHFEMPTDGPKNFNDVLPKGGFSGIFSVSGLPTELKVSYWIWLVGGILGILGGLLALIGAFAIMAAGAGGFGAIVLLLALIALVLGAAQIVLAMKMKEGREWARLALTVVAGIQLLLSIFSTANAAGAGGNWFGFVISAVAVVLMWLPNSQAWFAAVKGRV